MLSALIPPVPDLDRFATGPGIHLLLSHLFDKDGYLDYYARRSRAGDYLILDNSAHENGIGNKMEDLLEQASYVGVNEVVVPDVLFDARATVEAARRTLRYLETKEGQSKYTRAERPRLMYVPQGTGRLQWTYCLRSLLNLHDHYCIEQNLDEPVIGVSKDYYNWPGGIPSLFDSSLTSVKATRPRVDFHLLGWPTDLWQTAAVARRYPWVRSTDSAKPFVYAKNKILLEPGGKVPDYPRRDERYFDEPLQEDVIDLAQRNVEVFAAAARNNLILK